MDRSLFFGVYDDRNIPAGPILRAGYEEANKLRVLAYGCIYHGSKFPFRIQIAPFLYPSQLRCIRWLAVGLNFPNGIAIPPHPLREAKMDAYHYSCSVRSIEASHRDPCFWICRVIFFKPATRVSGVQK